MTIIVGILTFILIVAVLLLALRPLAASMETYDVRVRKRKAVTESSAAEKPKDSALLSGCKALGTFVLQFFPQVAGKRTKEMLIQCNYRTPEHLAIFIGIKGMFVVGALVLGIISATGNPTNLLMCLPIGLCGWMMPNFFLAGRVKSRQSEILKELPTIVDLLIVCAQAGLGLLNCVDKVGKEVGDSCPVLAAEMKQLITDVKIFAKSAAHALAEMGERCGVEELTNVASSLIAAETKGSDISYPLRMQSEALREKMKRKKEEEASKVPVKMVPVIMVFVMPLILCPMLGPAVITIMQALGPGLAK